MKGSETGEQERMFQTGRTACTKAWASVKARHFQGTERRSMWLRKVIWWVIELEEKVEPGEVGRNVGFVLRVTGRH